MNKAELEKNVANILIYGNKDKVRFIDILCRDKHLTSFKIKEKNRKTGSVRVTSEDRCNCLNKLLSNSKDKKSKVIISDSLRLKTNDITVDKSEKVTVTYESVYDDFYNKYMKRLDRLVKIQIIFPNTPSILPIFIITDNEDDIANTDILDIKSSDYIFNSLVELGKVTITEKFVKVKTSHVKNQSIDKLINSIYKDSSLSKENCIYNDKGTLLEYHDKYDFINYNLIVLDNGFEQITRIGNEVVRYCYSSNGTFIYYFANMAVVRLNADDEWDFINNQAELENLINSIHSTLNANDKLNFATFIKNKENSSKIDDSIILTTNINNAEFSIIYKNIHNLDFNFNLFARSIFSSEELFNFESDKEFAKMRSFSRIYFNSFYRTNLETHEYYSDNDFEICNNKFISKIYNDTNNIHFRDIFGIPCIYKQHFDSSKFPIPELYFIEIIVKELFK